MLFIRYLVSWFGQKCYLVGLEHQGIDFGMRFVPTPISTTAYLASQACELSEIFQYVDHAAKAVSLCGQKYKMSTGIDATKVHAHTGLADGPNFVTLPCEEFGTEPL
jgi:hypothetical protein